MSTPAMSETALWPPRRAILVVGIVAVSICVLIGTSFTMIAFVAGTTLTAFFMGHVERKMYPTSTNRNDGNTADHSTDESAENRPRKTTTTTTED